jgi:hypothetical protein
MRMVAPFVVLEPEAAETADTYYHQALELPVAPAIDTGSERSMGLQKPATSPGSRSCACLSTREPARRFTS